MNNKNLSFVLKYYREGKLDTKRAIQKVRERTMLSDTRTIPMQRWIAIAASLLLLVSVALVVNYRYERQHYAQQQPKDTFDNPEDAAAETQRALLKFSETINKAIQ